MVLPLAAGNAQAQGPANGVDVNLQKQQGIATITTDNMTVTIESHGNVPKFSFYANDENSTRFHVHFIKIMEFNDSNEDGEFNESEHESGAPALSLSSVTWNLSDFIEEGNLISFNFTSDEIMQGQGGAQGPNEYENLTIVLAIHVDSTNGTAFKFDILMSDWPFADLDNMLALRWDLTWDAEENDTISVDPRDDGAYLVRNETDIAYFVYEDTAQIDSADVSVSISYDDKMTDSAFSHGIKAFLSYPNFNGSQLVHDPTVGVIVTLEDGEPDPTSEPTEPSSETAGTSAGDGTGTIIPFPVISRAGFLGITVVTTGILLALYVVRRRQQ
jgi:hypothetical protein